MKMTSLLLSAALFPAFLQAEALNVDKDHSSILFSIEHLGIAQVKGVFTEFEATVKVENEELTHVQAEIPVSSIHTANEKRDEHLRSGDFFNGEEFSSIRFESTKIKGGKIHGNLTILGVTKEVKLKLDFSGPVQDPWGNTRYGMTLKGKVDRTDFGMDWNKTLENGENMIGDKVYIEINVELVE